MIRSAAATRPAVPPHLTFDDMITVLTPCLLGAEFRVGRVLLPACLYFRERFVGPEITITKTATTHQTKASSHASRTESAPVNIGEKKLPETALLAACINMTISTLMTLVNTQLEDDHCGNDQHDIG